LQKTIVLADSKKFRISGFGIIGGFEGIDGIIADKGISEYGESPGGDGY